MGTGRKVGLVVLGVVFVVVLLAANLVVAVDRTVLDAEYVKTTAEEESAYEDVADELRGEILQEAALDEAAAIAAPESIDGDDGGGAAAEQADGVEEWPFERSEEELLEATISEAYVQSQVEQNVDRLYAYLDGETDTLRLEVDLQPAKENLYEVLETEMENVDLGALGIPEGEAIDAMAENETRFEAEREAFRSDIEAEIRDEQKAAIQRETRRELSDDELEAAAEDEYDEGELDDEIDARIETARDEFREETAAKLRANLSGPAEELEEPLVALGTAYTDAVTGAADHDEYVQRTDEAKAGLGDAMVDVAEEELDEEMPETVELTAEMDDEAVEAAETAQQGTSAVSTLAVALPAAALALAGLLAWAAPVSAAAVGLGVGSLVVGVVGIASGRLAVGTLVSMLEADQTLPEAASVVTALLSGVGDALVVQSAMLSAVGVGLVGVGVGHRRGVVDIHSWYGDSEGRDESEGESNDDSDANSNDDTEAQKSDSEESGDTG